MVKRKRIREKGKIKLSEYFKTLKKGDNVAIIKEKSLSFSFPEELQGRSGQVTGSKGSHKLIKLKQGKSEKTYIIHPVHLKKL